MLIKLFWFVSVAVVEVILFYVDVDVPILLFAASFSRFPSYVVFSKLVPVGLFSFFFLFYNARISIFVFSSTITIQYIMAGIYNGKSLN